jgi:hypothetical protein
MTARDQSLIGRLVDMPVNLIARSRHKPELSGDGTIRVDR